MFIHPLVTQNFRPFLLGVVFSSAVLAAACDQPKAEPVRGAAAAQVTVVTLKPETVTVTRVLPGRTSPFLVAEVRPQVNGIVKKRLFTEGGVVKGGQALYQLEDGTYRADFSSAEAALARAQVTHDSARVTAQRTAELARDNLTTTQENENAVARVQQAAADSKAAEAALQRSRVILGYTRIVSPISGRIGKSSVTQGALVTANQATSLATVQQLDPIYVDLTQSSSELLQLRKQLAAGTLETTKGLPVTILLEDGTRYLHDGTLAFADVTVEPSTGSYALRVQVPNPDNVLLPGMYVRAVISTGTRQNALLVPQQGIQRDPKGNATAMIVDKDGKVAQRPVQASQTLGDSWLVDSGLSAGDRVIVEGLQKVRPNMPAKATEAPKTANAVGADAGSR